jgi:hypothetical protein
MITSRTAAAPKSMKMMLRFIGRRPFRIERAIAATPGSSNPPRQEQHNDDDQQDADHAYAAMTEPIAIASEPPTEAAQQKNDQYNDEYCADRHQ